MQALWAAVLSQAVLDAIGRAGFCAKDYTVRGVLHSPHAEAREWFEQGGPDFHAVCGLAGVDGDALRHAVLHAPDQIGSLGIATDRPRPRPARPQGRAA